MISRDKYWIRISKKGSPKRKHLAGQWICFGEKTALHNLKDELDKYVENNEITLILISLKEKANDKFPNKPCVLCAFTSNSNTEKQKVRSILEDKFSLKVERWKSNWESIKDWDDNGLLKIESQIIQLKQIDRNDKIRKEQLTKEIVQKILTYITNNTNPDFQEYVSKENFIIHLNKSSHEVNNINQAVHNISNIFDRICIYIWDSLTKQENIGNKEVLKELNSISKNTDSIILHLDEQLKYITSQLPNKQFIHQNILDINKESVEDIISWLTIAFQNQAIRELENFVELERIFLELKKSDNWESKIKFIVPLLNLVGINIELENKFNLKKHIKNIKNELDNIIVKYNIVF